METFCAAPHHSLGNRVLETWNAIQRHDKQLQRYRLLYTVRGCMVEIRDLLRYTVYPHHYRYFSYDHILHLQVTIDVSKQICFHKVLVMITDKRF